MNELKSSALHPCNLIFTVLILCYKGSLREAFRSGWPSNIRINHVTADRPATESQSNPLASAGDKASETPPDALAKSFTHKLFMN
ncbi:hypothetical protein TNCT_111951 [Trichonephila clavata]|uniref:Uncharacterized protein n=1 Tax=Trichonephila clavata TaxID=2740835 RepID=A0A8X6M4M2_TRICU|nr:hypothetical protein TNCT_111951 [Trichonephila clavata]